MGVVYYQTTIYWRTVYKINLITDVSVSPVNVNDDEIINERIAKLKTKTPDIGELHSDGSLW